MKIGAAARLFASKAVWGVTGIDAAGRVLVEALATQRPRTRVAVANHTLALGGPSIGTFRRLTVTVGDRYVSWCGLGILGRRLAAAGCFMVHGLVFRAPGQGS